MKWLDKELPGFRHGLKRHPSQRIGVHRNATPAKDSQPLDIRRCLYGSTSLGSRSRREKRKAQPEDLWKRNALLLRPRAKESVRYRSEQAGAIAARAIRVDTATVRQTFERG
jgi:hypothetical protein